ncbi:MAG TPA: GcrA family cell cycle regulator [Alphaproteobacteria bacterium]|nr:GcrA family cell cycle regulator [Alphaproteobacteria bacterium]
MDWTEERIAILRRLWAQGLSASQIAEQLGSVTRNAVIGKAHRLGLAGRPSPIKNTPEVAAPSPRAVKYKPTNYKGPACQWPIGDPTSQDFEFCGAPTEPGRPYCAAHCEAAYIRRDNKAA